MSATIEGKFRRDLEPKMWRAIQLGEELRDYPYEKVDVAGYVRLEKAVKAIENFLGSNGEEKS